MTEFKFSPASPKQALFLQSDANIVVYGGEYCASN